ncbi:RNA ligase [Gordonia phage Verity]|uniref:RNA ligase n=1 Tax=Gordonia phage Verity TaxID=2591211 RepID=A0A514DIS8_9CAUD|nr:head maturation protease [Gordonia phage Verity]QDH93504.1 RNA ligase [Gordonia phage Verity]QPO16861.1 RNA ligase [Gordonia phage Delrey21]QXN74144.1 capsid maturation protease [Gordonia phage DoctorFroggo]
MGSISTIGPSLTAAGVVFDIADFRDPKLDQLTPLQVTKDGRVYGHLAGWKTNHIGYSKPTPPPRSATGYKYFHQGLAPTNEGDLPVGYLTLGTGHAGEGDAMSAAAHYDNTGAQVAQVRVGEDDHGIWLAGRVLPTTDDMQRQTLRRSSLSGDWRKIKDPTTGRKSMELVAALSVNVPGFPIPRTEQLVASGAESTMLVAAGFVRNGPITHAEVEQMIAASTQAAQEQYERQRRQREIVASAAPTVEALTAAARARRRDELTASAKRMHRAELDRRFTAIVAAGAAVVNDVTGHMPAQLHRYWTQGEGLAKWAPTATPYRSLVAALSAEIHDMTPEQIKGLAANLYHDVFGEWPGRKSKDGGKLSAALMPPTPDEAQRLVADMAGMLADLPVPGQQPEVPEPVDEPVVHTGGMVALLPTAADAEMLAVAGGDPVEEIHLTLVYLGDDLTQTSDEWRQGVQEAVTEVLEPTPEGGHMISGRVFGRAAFNENSDDSEACAVYLIEANGITGLVDRIRGSLGNRAPASDFDAFVPHITAGYGIDTAALYGAVGSAITFDRVRVSIADVIVDIPLAGPIDPDLDDAPILGEVPAELPADEDDLEAAGKRRAQTQEGADKYGVSIGDVIGKGVDDAVDVVDDTAKAVQRDIGNVAKAVGDAIFGRRDDATPPPPPPAPAPKAETPPPPAAAPKNKATPPPAAPAVPPTPPGEERPKDGPPPPPPVDDTPVDATVGGIDTPDPRKDVGAGTDHPMAEDESPDLGAEGGDLVSFDGDRGVAVYSDGTETDGTKWTRSPVLPDMGYDGTTMLEDQAPYKGAHGGQLVEYDGDAGVARYDDGTETDGTRWRSSTRVVS